VCVCIVGFSWSLILSGNKQKTVLAKQETKQIGHAIEKLAAKQEAK